MRLPLLLILLIAAALITAQDASATFDQAFQALKEATIRKSPDILAAEALARQKTAETYTSWTRWLPRADLQLTQSRSQDFSILSSGALGENPFFANFVPEERALSSWSLNLSVPLYRRAVHLQLRQSMNDSTLASAQLDSRRTEVDWRLRSALGNYLLQSYRLATLHRSIEIAQTSLRDAKLRFQLGERTRLDVIRAEANLISLESKRLTNAQEKSAALNTLLDYAGLDPAEYASTGFDRLLSSEQSIGEAIDAFATLDPLLPRLKAQLGADLETVTQEALDTRLSTEGPAYRTILGEQKVADIRAQSLMAQEWPELSLRASLSKQAENWSDALAGGNRSHSVAFVLNIPVFSSGSLFSSRLENERASEANEIRRERDAQRLRHEVQDQLNQIRAFRKTLDSQHLALERNEELVRLSQKSYQLGKTTLLELLTSQNDLLDSKLALAQSKINLAVLTRKFAWNLGVSLE